MVKTMVMIMEILTEIIMETTMEMLTDSILVLTMPTEMVRIMVILAEI